MVRWFDFSVFCQMLAGTNMDLLPGAGLFENKASKRRSGPTSCHQGLLYFFDIYWKYFSDIYYKCHCEESWVRLASSHLSFWWDSECSAAEAFLLRTAIAPLHTAQSSSGSLICVSVVFFLLSAVWNNAPSLHVCRSMCVLAAGTT